MYICLFTCAVVRAIHLELVEDQTTDAFLRAFRRFISRRGVPECIISDNAKTFKAGAQELQTIKTQILGTGSSQQFLAHHNITWKFITERAPWWGGFYERLIGLMKRCLKKTLGKACLNMIELNTILTEVEAVLNSRPLTYPYTDINDASPLTPSHFLCGYRLLTLPETNAKENEADRCFKRISFLFLVQKKRLEVNVGEKSNLLSVIVHIRKSRQYCLIENIQSPLYQMRQTGTSFERYN